MHFCKREPFRSEIGQLSRASIDPVDANLMNWTHSDPDQAGRQARGQR